MTRKTPPPPPATAKARTPKATGRWVNFTLPGIDVPLKKWSGPRRPGVPAIDPTYVFREELVREFAWAVWPHDGGDPTPCLLAGQKGCGKTSLIMQLAAHCNVAVSRANMNVGTTTRHLKGRIGADSGSTVFVPGILTTAMEEGHWLILDEISGTTPPVAMALFPALEFSPPGEVLLEDAQPPRYVQRHADFRLFGTDNTIGAEQEESRFNYGGTSEMNSALLDRFGSFIQCRYMSPAEEHAAITAKVPAVDSDVLEGMIRVANNVRQSAEIGTGFSTRMVYDWARRYAAGHARAKGKAREYDFKDVLDLAHPAFLNKTRSKIEREALIENIRRVFPIGGA